MATAKGKPLTEKVRENIIKHGGGSTDAIAKRMRTKARPIGKALSQLKRRGRATFKANKASGENVWALTAKGKKDAK